MFTRSDLLSGLPARRASTILFAVEATTARLLAASRINRAAYVGERTSSEREQEFLRAVAAGGRLPEPPSVADVERFSPNWASLVPESPETRAAIARLLAAKHRFRSSDVPGIRAALGLDEPGVASAYERLHGESINSIYRDRLAARDRWRWATSRLTGRFDRMPPAWIAFFLALAEVLGEGILSLPLALAGLGPLPGIAVLLVLGVVNLVTMAAMAEAVVRNGSMRYGVSYVRQLVRELLGRVPASALAVVFALDGVLTLCFYFLGFGSVLAGATGVPIGLWIAGLFLVNVWLLRRETLDATVASAIVIGLALLTLIVAITAVALANVDPANLGAPTTDGAGPDPRALGIVFGVVLMAFFAHSSAANSAKLLLTIEPTGRALVRGNVAAMALVIGLYIVASYAIVGVVGTAPLATTDGTALTPLADRLGPAVSVMAVTYTVLAIGISSLYVTLGTYNLVTESLPRGPGRAGWLARLTTTRRGRLVAGFAPAAAIMLVVEGLVLTGTDDFAGIIGFAGALTVPIITGVFPMLLVLAARRKGEYVPGLVFRIVGHPVTVVGILILYFAAMGLHVLIWQSALERAAAVGATVAALALVAGIARTSSFAPRAVVEVRVDQRAHRTVVNATAGGRSIVHDRSLGRVDAGGEAVAAVELPGGPWRSLRVWPHAVTPDGWSGGLPATVEMETSDKTTRLDLPASADPVIVPLGEGPTTVHLRLAVP